MSTDTQLHESDISLDALRRVVLQDGESSCFFNLRELTRHEYVSIGSDGNILRWGAAPGFAPKWLIVPADAAGHCRIYTVQNGECMTVGSDGNILRGADTHGPEQLFKFVNHRQSDDSYDIQENTHGEFVAVGSDGNILRWAGTGGEEQRFILEVTDIFQHDPETIARILRNRPLYPDADAVPPPPAMTTLWSNPVATKEDYWIGVDTLSSVFVNDPSYSNKIEQVRRHPYYYLCRTRHWEKVSDRLCQRGLSQSQTVVVTHGCSCHDLRSIEATIGVIVGTKLGGKIGREPGKGGGISARIGGELNFQYSWQRGELEEMARKHEEYHRETETVEFVPTEECRLVLWQLVDQYTLFDTALRAVCEPWTVYSGRTEWDCFPQRAAPGLKALR